MSTGTATPATPAEWEEYVNTVLGTPEAANAAIADGSFAEAVKGYGDALRNESNKTMKDLAGQLKAEVSASVLEMFKNNGAAVDGRPDVRPVNEKALKAGTAYNKYSPAVQVEKIWDSAGQMVQDILARKPNAEQRNRLDAYDEFKNAYSGNVPSTGGYLVPEEVRSEIMTRALEGAVVRPQATVVPMPTSKFRWPVNDMTTENGEVYGGIIMSWLDEGETFTATEGTFASIGLNAHKLGGLASVPNELIRHISALEAWLRVNMPNAIKHFEDLAFLKGNGVGRPLGGLHANNPAMIVATAETNQPADTITWPNILAMFSRLLPESYERAEWDITPDAISEIFTMALPVGTGGSAIMVGEGSGPSRLPSTILGIPVRFTRKAPAVLGDQGDISLVDWSNYVVGDTTAMQLDVSEHSSFTSDKTDFRILLEVDGQPGMLAALTPENGGPTLSAYIQLATR